MTDLRQRGGGEDAPSQRAPCLQGLLEHRHRVGEPAGDPKRRAHAVQSERLAFPIPDRLPLRDGRRKKLDRLVRVAHRLIDDADTGECVRLAVAIAGLSKQREPALQLAERRRKVAHAQLRDRDAVHGSRFNPAIGQRAPDRLGTLVGLDRLGPIVRHGVQEREPVPRVRRLQLIAGFCPQ